MTYILLCFPLEQSLARTTDSGRVVGNPEVIRRGPPTRAAGVSHGINTPMRHARDLTDEQWKILDPLIPKPGRRRDGRGRPWKSRRSVMNGILWVLRTAASWADLPDRYPSFQTCHGRFQHYERHAEIFLGMLHVASSVTLLRYF